MTRKEVNWRQHVGDLANTLKAFIGTNYLGLAYGFKLAGLGFGILGLVIVATLTNHCCKLIVVCKKRAIAQLLQQYTAEIGNGDEDDVEFSLLRTRLISNLSYSDLGRLTFGRWGVVIVNTCVIVTQLGFCIGYGIFVGNMTHQLITRSSHNQITVNFEETSWEGLTEDIVKRSINDTDFGFDSTGQFLGNSIQNLSGAVYETDLYNNSDQSVHLQTFETVPTLIDNDGSEENDINITNPGNGDLFVKPSTTQFASENIADTKSEKSSIEPTLKHETISLPTSYTFTAPDTNVSTLFPSRTNFTESTIRAEKDVSSSLLTWTVLATLPLFVVLTFFRNVRQLAMISMLANVSIFSGFFCVLGYIVYNFKLADDVEWFNFITMPVYFVQIFAAFEAIGCILPIESSMDGNQHNFPLYINVVMISYSSLMGIVAMLGYLNYGGSVQQIIAQNLPVEEPLVVVISITLIIGVVLTYPLQIFPVVEILENMVFGEGKCCGPPKRKTFVDDDDDEDIDELAPTQGLLDKPPQFSLPIAVFVPKSVPAWRRNIFRALIAALVVFIAVFMRNIFAYVNAIVGAVGSGPLLFIFPCLFHNKLVGKEISTLTYVKNIAIIVFGVICSVVGLIVSIVEVIEKI